MIESEYGTVMPCREDVDSITEKFRDELLKRIDENDIIIIASYHIVSTGGDERKKMVDIVV